uniref:Magnesium-dependent phosphatase 1 n=1 Tax=Callorhinchus milii TaxID=7868 RepID=V9LFF5_CALMI
METAVPKLVAFDLDYTLWPFWVDTHVNPPFRMNKNSQVVDSANRVISLYPDVLNILRDLKRDGFQLAAVSRTGEKQGANQLLSLFEMEQYFSYKQIYPGSKVTHFQRIRDSSGIKYQHMIFFDDEQRNITDVSQLGVTCILVPNGMTQKILEDGMRRFAQDQKSRG